MGETSSSLDETYGSSRESDSAKSRNFESVNRMAEKERERERKG